MPRYSSTEVLIRNVFYNLITHIYFIILAFLATPYIVHKLGTDAYGIFSIIGVIIGYFAFLDLGLGQAVIKYISQYYAKKEEETIGKIIRTALSLYLVMGLLGAALIIYLTNLLVTRMLKIPIELADLTRWLFYLSALGFIVNMLVQVLSAIPQALQRFDITNKIQLILGSAVILFTVLFLYFGCFLKELVLLNVFVSVISIFAYLKIARRLLPQVSFWPGFDFDVFKILFRFGGFSSLGRLMSTITVHIDKLLIGIFLPIHYLTYYIIPYNISSKMNFIIPSVISAIFPAMSDLDALNRQSQVQELYFRTSKYITTGIILFAIFFIALGRELLRFWLGVDFALHATLPLQILSLGMLVNCFSWVPGMTASAVNKPEMTASLNTLQAIIGLFLCLVLIPRLGIVGAALSWTIRDILLVPLFIHIINRKLMNITNRSFIRNSLAKPLILGAVLFLLFSLIKGLVTNLFDLIIAGSIMALFYFIAAYFFIFDKTDKIKLSNYLYDHIFAKLFAKMKSDLISPQHCYAKFNLKVMKPAIIKIKDPISISFYTLTYNRLEYTKRMIESLIENTHEPYQHVIIDQQSTDGTREYLAGLKSSYPHIDWEIVYMEKNIGLVHGQNMAIDRCKGNLLVKIDNDSRVLSKDIDKHIKAIYRCTGFQYVLSPFPIGLIRNLGGTKRYGFEIYYSEETDRYYTLGLTKNVGGLFRCMPREILAKVDGWKDYKFDVEQPLPEDVFISGKILSAGYKIAYIENDCVVEHQESTLGQHERYGDAYFQGRF